MYRSLGAKRREVLQGPRKGLDNAVLSLPEGKVMIFTADPVSMIPALGPRVSAWLSVHLIASDFTTSGVSPEFATFTFNFPPSMDPSDRDTYLREIGRACAELGVSIVAGHTGSYPGAAFTVIGGGTMFGFAQAGSYVDSSMAHQGDLVLITKGAAIEATASLANSFPDYTRKAVGAHLSAKARALVTSCSTVKDALTAANLGLGEGGVSSMHDATEGGVLGALDEMAAASGKSFVVEQDKIPVSPEVAAVCAAFGLDPLRTMGEGALILTCGRRSVERLERAFSRTGLPVTQIGEVRTGKGLDLSSGGKAVRFSPGPDKYWAAFHRATRRRLG